ncbi:DMT family transporter [Aureimonas glaciei]|uniref:Permease n=1 Tax=Aureimonas glaciei TaxID=1776957 RepID=A0A916Y4S9_9HYPH|nr:DMT family transporter [Aureimonas glaciei]GGD30557.1 permease [Aureimonas glaciei]
MKTLSDRGYGIALVTLAAVLWSTAGLFIRLLDLDVWTILGWRSVFGGVALALIAMAGVSARQRTPSTGTPKRFGRMWFAAVFLSALSMVAYIAALKLTTVANVLAIYATVPFVAAGLALVWLGERVGRRVLTASAVAFVGVLVVAGFALTPDDVAGNALAFLMTVCFAALVVMSRRHPGMGMAEISAYASLACVAICWPLMSTEIPSGVELVILAGFGVTSTALAYLLFLVGGRYIPSGEAGLIALLDVVLGPLWVWLAFGEDPGTATLFGGGLILASVGWYLWSSFRDRAVVVPA